MDLSLCTLKYYNNCWLTHAHRHIHLCNQRWNFPLKLADIKTNSQGLEGKPKRIVGREMRRWRVQGELREKARIAGRETEQLLFQLFSWSFMMQTERLAHLFSIICHWSQSTCPWTDYWVEDPKAKKSGLWCSYINNPEWYTKQAKLYFVQERKNEKPNKIRLYLTRMKHDAALKNELSSHKIMGMKT